MANERIVVVGAGVAGLTTALLLAKESRYQITVAAKHMPGDYDIEYASPWAGANFWPISEAGTEAAEWDKTTWPELEDLARHHPEAGVHFQDTAIYNRTKDVNSNLGRYLAEKLKAEPWYKDVVPNFRQLSREQLGTQYSNGHAFTSVCINTAIYLPWLASQCLFKGVVFKRANLKHVRDASVIHHTGQKADLVVNCTGLSSLKFGGVEDQNMMPIRGQTVLVRNEANIMCSSSGTDDGEEEVCYLMQRAAGGGTLLGGSYQRGNWDSQLDPNLAIRIMKRAVELCPALTDGKGIEHLDIIRHGVGLRPYRQGSTRIEKERIDGVWTVHNYGHGGFGYQASYGCAKKAVKLVGEVLTPRSSL
ncbi:MAG: hypothetical protein LQ339_002590 [Xanthoria mediterranea]|nr:MAG: hypothetical protein LQ339_002590 [Xanthoria mediterranea]